MITLSGDKLNKLGEDKMLLLLNELISRLKLGTGEVLDPWVHRLVVFIVNMNEPAAESVPGNN